MEWLAGETLASRLARGPLSLVDSLTLVRCGPGDGLGNTTSTASHELLEAVTDLQLDAWFASDGEEIADLCQGVQAQVSGFTVQRAWSDLQQACVVKNPCLACPGGWSCRCGDFMCRSNTSQCP
jgi:hypothetical protein